MNTRNIYNKALVIMVSCLLCCSTTLAATKITATLEHTGATYYMNGETYKQTYDAETERYNNAGGQRSWNGQAAMKFSFNLPAGKTVIAATLTWSTTIYGNPSTRNNSFYYMNLGKDLDWDAFARGRGNMIMAMPGSPYTYFTNVELNGTNQGTLHTNVETDVTSAVQAVESQGYITLFVTNNAVGGDLNGKGSSHAPSLSITYADKRTVTFVAGDDATCATTSLSCASEGSVTSVTLPTATDNNGAEFMGWYTAPIGGTRIGGAGDTYEPSGDITLYAQYNRMPTAITVAGESTIKYGTTTTLTATLSPSNTVNSGIQWFSGDADIATVDQNGVVTATGLGTVDITVRATADPTNVRKVFKLTVESNNYSYTVNAVDGNNNVLKVLATGTYTTEPNNIAIPVPQYVLSGTTLYETARVNGNHYNYYIIPDADGYVANKPYTNSTVDDVVYYTEAEECTALPIKVVNSTTQVRASNDTIARNTAYEAVITLVPGTYTIKASASNGNDNAFTYKFKVGNEEVMSSDVVAKGNNINATSSPFTINEKKTLYVYCPAGNSGGLDNFYIVQDPVYHVTTNEQKLELNKATIDATIYTTVNPVNKNGNDNGTHNGVTGPFYNIKNKKNYVTVTFDGATAFRVDAFHNNTKDTRTIHIYIDGEESVSLNVTPGTYVSSPVIATGGTGQHTIKLTGDGDDVYIADVVFYKDPVTPTINYTNAAVKVGETLELTLRLPYGCIFNENAMTNAGDASKVTATFTRMLDSDNTYRKGTLTLVGIAATGNTPTNLTFSIKGNGTVYMDGESNISVDVLKAGLTLSYTDGDTGDDATEYVCNADVSTPALPTTLRLNATDDNGAPVSLNTLTISYASDDPSVATVDANGNITLVQPYGNGTATITATSTNNSNYDDAKAQYSITIQRGINWKVATHPVFKNNAPAVRDTFHVYRNEAGVEKLYLVGTFGGWNRNNNTYNYPQTNGSTKARTDSWGGLTNSSGSGIDGFSKYRSGKQDACNETMYSSLQQYYNDVIYGVERFGWFKQPDGNTTYPFTLPVRGSYITLEPEVNGTLSIYIEQNGPWNPSKNDVYDNDGNFISVDANGNAVKFPGNAPFQYRPHAFFIVDQNGNLVEKNTPVKIITRTKVKTGIAESSNKDAEMAVLEAFCANYACEKGEKFKCILDENADGYNDVTNIGNWKEFKEYMSPGEQQRVHDNWAAGVNGAQIVTKLDNGAYLALDPGMVKYTFHVIAGQTYYIFSNFSKIGFSGVNFVPDDENQPSGTLALSEKVAYDPSSLNPGDAVNTKPMYETITLDRKFTTGKWNTICLPFTMTEKEVETVFGKNTELIILDRVNVDAGHASIFMTYHEIQNILAGYPYLIKPTQDVDHIEVHNKVIDPDQQVLAFSNNGYTSKGTRNFCTADVTNAKGTVNNYSYCLKAGDIFLNSNTLYVSAGNSYLYGYRSYLELEPGATGAKSVSMNYSNAWFDDEEESETTSIAVAEFAPDALEAMGITTTGNGVYNLGGQRVADTLTGLPKGIYIMNGNKVVVE